MTKKLVLVFGCLALLTSLATIAQADAITFTYMHGKGTPAVHVDTTGVSLVNAQQFLVTDTTTDVSMPLVGFVQVSTGSATSYTAAMGLLAATFAPGTGLNVQVDAPACVGGSLPGICLQGTANGGSYAATRGGTGSFESLFKVTYVSPFVTSLFGLPNTWQSVGSDSFTTSDNVFVDRGSTDTARLGSGQVTFQTPVGSGVPEPGTLALMGSGILGMAGLIRRRKS